MKLRLCILGGFLFIPFSIVFLHSGIEIGEKIRIRNFVINNNDFDSSVQDRRSFWEQRAVLYTKFKLNKEFSSYMEIWGKGRFGQNESLLHPSYRFLRPLPAQSYDFA